MGSPEIDKPFSIRMVEFIQSLRVIKDCLESMALGGDHSVIPLSGQLRSLLTERSKGTTPLLKEIASKVGVDLDLFAMPGIDEDLFPASVDEKLEFRIAAFPVGIKRQYKGQVPDSIDGILDRKVVFVNGRDYSTRNLIEWFANKSGGSHYAARVPPDFAKITAYRFGQEPTVNAVIHNMGVAAFELGRKVLRASANVDVHVILQFSPDLATGGFLIDAQYPGNPMRIALIMEPRGRPRFVAIGLQGRGIDVTLDQIVDWSRPRYLRASLHLNDDLSTTAKLSFDAEDQVEVKVEYPIFLTDNFNEYDVYFNKAHDGPEQDFYWGLNSVMVVRRLSAATEAGIVWETLKQRDQAKNCVVYLPKSYGYAPSMTGNQQIVGRAIRVEVADFYKPLEELVKAAKA